MKLIRLICIILICVSLNGCAIWLADDDVQREVYYTTHYRPYHPAPHRPVHHRPAPKHKCHPDAHQKPDCHQTHRPSGKPGKPNQKPTVKPNQKPNNGNNPRPNGSVSSSPNRPRTKK